MAESMERVIADEAAFDRGPGTAARRADWAFATSGTEDAQAAAQEANLAVRRHYADAGRYELLAAWQRETGETDPLLLRQARLLWQMYLGEQQDAASVERLTRLQAEQEGLFNRFRADLDGRAWSENDLNEALEAETDAARVRRVWEAAKQIGGHAAERALAMVRLRNEAASRQGFANAFQRELTLGDLTEARLFDLLDELEAATDAPYRQAKAALDARLAARFQISAAELRPWHYGDPFFQRPPRSAGPQIDGYFAGKDLADLAVRTLGTVGLDARGVLARSDLHPRAGKNQHAFCMYVQPDGRDVRVLCNLNQTYHWMTVLLHELGHAMHWEYGNRALPALLVHPPHSLVAETESQLLERLAGEAAWLVDVAGVPADEADRIAAGLREQERLSSLIFTRWSLLMAHFERGMFQDPDGDLDTLWWDLVERFQLVPRPDGRRAPDWAAKIHLAQFPGSYYVYILGELAVAQMDAALKREVGGFYGEPSAGSFLIDRLYRLGQQWDWETTVAMATGSRLGAATFVRELAAR